MTDAIIGVLGTVLGVGLVLALLYYRDKAARAAAETDSALDKIDRVEVEFAQAQEEDRRAAEIEAAGLRTRAERIEFLRNAVRKK